MKTAYVIVADLSHARIFALRPRESSDDENARHLVHVSELQHAGRRERASEIFSDSRPGLRAISGGGPTHGVDDGRDAERAESDRRFAKDIVQAAQQHLDQHERATLIMAASPYMLGCLRKEAGHWHKDSGLRIHELDKQLAQLSASELHDYLAGKELLPVRT